MRLEKCILFLNSKIWTQISAKMSEMSSFQENIKLKEQDYFCWSRSRARH